MVMYRVNPSRHQSASSEMSKSMNPAPTGNARGRNKGRKLGTSMNFWILPQQHPLLASSTVFPERGAEGEMASQQGSGAAGSEQQALLCR